MNTEQRIAFNAWAEIQNPKVYPAEWQAFQAGWQAALASPEVQALRKDAERLMFACEFDGFTTVKKDRYEYAIECARESGRDIPTKEDELNGLRRLIDAAIEAKK